MNFELECQLPFSLNWKCQLQKMAAVPAQFDIEAPSVQNKTSQHRLQHHLHDEQQLCETLQKKEAIPYVEEEAGRHKPFFVPTNS